jgi:hypothetical protein
VPGQNWPLAPDGPLAQDWLLDQEGRARLVLNAQAGSTNY